MKTAVFFGPDEATVAAELLHAVIHHGTESREAMSLLATVVAEFDVERVTFALLDLVNILATITLPDARFQWATDILATSHDLAAQQQESTHG